jgi:TPP-dependent 2-oxoacid decarboxylase
MRKKVNTSNNKREVHEEIGFKIDEYFDPNNFLTLTFNEQVVKLYIIVGVDENTKFETLTRNEIAQIKWHNINEISNSNKFYNVSPFLKKIKKKIYTQTKVVKIKKNEKENNQKEVEVYKKDQMKEEMLNKKVSRKLSYGDVTSIAIKTSAFKFNYGDIIGDLIN